MRYARLIPVAVLAFAVACSDTATSPTSVDGPQFLVGTGTYGNVTTLNSAGTPGGAHFQQGTNTPVTCTVSLTLVVTCSGNGPYEIAGLGNDNAQAFLSASYEATVDCTNKGGKLVPVKSQATTGPTSTDELEAKNGRLTVPVLQAGVPSDAVFEAQAVCPNGNWTKSVAEGDPTLVSFSYQLFFIGFGTPAISISAS